MNLLELKIDITKPLKGQRTSVEKNFKILLFLYRLIFLMKMGDALTLFIPTLILNYIMTIILMLLAVYWSEYLTNRTLTGSRRECEN